MLLHVLQPGLLSLREGLKLLKHILAVPQGGLM